MIKTPLVGFTGDFAVVREHPEDEPFVADLCEEVKLALTKAIEGVAGFQNIVLRVDTDLSDEELKAMADWK
jgi:hypothetical protein